MISILGDYNYSFPKPIKLEKKLKDLLEDNVDEKYYLSDKAIQGMTNTSFCSYKLENRLQDLDNACDTLLTSSGNRCPHCIPIKNDTKKGYIEATDGDGIDISSRMEHHRGTVQKNKIQTLTTQCDRGVVTKPRVLGGIGEKDSNNNTQWKQQNRIYDENVAISITTSYNPYYKNDLRIRKLTPCEAFRLMGVKDEDYKKCAKNQSDSSLYHLAGDSIVVNVLMAIFKEMI